MRIPHPGSRMAASASPDHTPALPPSRHLRLARLLARAGLVLGAGWLAACSSVSPQHASSSTASRNGQPAIVAESDAVRELDAAQLAQGDDAGTEVVVSNDLWGRIRAGFAMPELDSPLVARHEQYYLSRPEYLQRMFGRGSRYLHHIVEEVERRGMPTELALLPFVESAMNPTAMSSAKAAGLWQFIPSTGRQYNLNQNWWVDNRRDVEASTRAALDYLQTVYEMNGDDWFLALASYNWGEGAVRRAVKANERAGRPADYAHLRMPAETRNYVPKLLAIKHIVQNASRLGLALPELPDQPYFVTVEKTRPIDLKLAAQFAGMTEAEFLELNPAHNRPVISATRTNTLKIPVDRIERFKAAMAAHAARGKPFVTWHPYTMQRGESLAGVAGRAGLSVPELLRANGIAPGTHLLAGSRLLVPQNHAGDDSLVEQFDGPRLYQQVDAGPLVHRVRRGETGASIARHYGLTLAELRSMNRRITRLRPGQTLVVRRTQRQTVLVAEDGSRQVISRQSAQPTVVAHAPAASRTVAARSAGTAAAASRTTAGTAGTRASGIRLVTYGHAGRTARTARAETSATSANRVARQVTTRSSRHGSTHHVLPSGSRRAGTAVATGTTAGRTAGSHTSARTSARKATARRGTRVAAVRKRPTSVTSRVKSRVSTRVAASGRTASTARKATTSKRTSRATRTSSLRQAGKVASAR